jgi:hypothetical protein
MADNVSATGDSLPPIHYLFMASQVPLLEDYLGNAASVTYIKEVKAPYVAMSMIAKKGLAPGYSFFFRRLHGDRTNINLV